VTPTTHSLGGLLSSG